MMDKETLDRIIELAHGEVAVETIDGVPMAARQLHQATPKLFEPSTLDIHTLTGLVGYLEANRDEIELDEVVVHVEGPTAVRVISGVKGKRNQRFEYARAAITGIEGAKFGVFVPPEMFTVWLMTLFTDTEDRAKVVALAGNVAAESSARQQDDGFTQEITVKGGVALVGKKEVPNPVTLAPYRTFREVAQPASPFLLRFKGGQDSPVTCALFEADGGTWELEAIANVVAWLENALPEYQVIG